VAIYAAAAAASEMYGMYVSRLGDDGGGLNAIPQGKTEKTGQCFFVWFKLLRALWETFRQQDKERDYQ